MAVAGLYINSIPRGHYSPVKDILIWTTLKPSIDLIDTVGWYDVTHQEYLQRKHEDGAPTFTVFNMHPDEHRFIRFRTPAVIRTVHIKLIRAHPNTGAPCVDLGNMIPIGVRAFEYPEPTGKVVYGADTETYYIIKNDGVLR